MTEATLRGFTPLTGDPGRIRAARIYPGGANLDRLIGEKNDPEVGWYYPEAWLFSPAAAVNPGSARTDEGLTVVDSSGDTAAWRDYVARHQEEVLAGGQLEITVKLLDPSCVLPKEFHFREEDVPRLLEGRGAGAGTLIKPEAWIRHPRGGEEASSSFIGFIEPLSSQEFLRLVDAGVEALESRMNEIAISPGMAAYIPGGVVHSLGRGLYFEVLAAGDRKVTLQREFAGRSLDLAERLSLVYDGEDAGMAPAGEFVELELSGRALLDRCVTHPEQLSGERTRIVDTPHFSAEWITLRPGGSVVLPGGRPHVLVTAAGEGRLEALERTAILQTQVTSWDEYSGTRRCYGAVMHGATREYGISSSGSEGLIVLAAWGARE